MHASTIAAFLATFLLASTSVAMPALKRQSQEYQGCEVNAQGGPGQFQCGSQAGACYNFVTQDGNAAGCTLQQNNANQGQQDVSQWYCPDQSSLNQFAGALTNNGFDCQIQNN